MRLRFLSFSLAGLAVGLALSHCAPLTPTGELGNGQFTYVCTSGSVDTACTGAATSPESSISFEDPSPSDGTTTLPKVIAVGASFAINYAVLPDNSADSIQGDTGYAVVPASYELAGTEGDSLVALRAGYLALLAYDSAGQTVDDFVLVSFQPVATLTPSEAVLTLVPSSVGSVSVTAADMAGDPLGGRLACSWTVTSGADLVAFQGPTTGALVEVQGVAQGTAMARATCGGVSVDVTLRVNAAPATDGGLDQDGGNP